MAEKKLTKREQKAAKFRSRQKKQELSEDQAIPASDLIPEVQDSTTHEPESKPETKGSKRKASQQDDIEKANKKRREKSAGDKEKKPRFIVFVGNLSYDTTKEDLEIHFKSAGNVTSVRLMNDKATQKPKGFAFVEFGDSASLVNGLKLHRSKFKKRLINVELTAGGGGSKSEARKEKIKVKNERLHAERQAADKERRANKKGSSYQNSASTAYES